MGRLRRDQRNHEFLGGTWPASDPRLLHPGRLRARRAGPPDQVWRRQHPDVAAVLAEWERTLPTGFRAGRDPAATLAAMVRALIAGAHNTISDPSPRGCGAWSTGRSAFPGAAARNSTSSPARTNAPWSARHGHGSTSWTPASPHGWAAAGRGRAPGRARLDDIANLLWGLATQQISPLEIRDNLPSVASVAAGVAGLHRSRRPAASLSATGER